MYRLLVLVAAFLAAALQLAPQPATAKSPYDPVLSVNGDAITTWEIEQRAGFLRAIGLQGDLPTEARKALIDDRLKMAAAKAAGITISDNDLSQAMDEFVARGNVTQDQFREILTKNGVDWQTFQDVMRASLAWRDVVRAKFASRVQIGDDEVDRALTLTSEGGLRVLLSELIVPLPQGDTGQTLGFLKDLRASMTNSADFEKAARRYSGASTRSNGGKLDWMDLSKLPNDVQTAVLGMTPGEISQPIELQKAVALFELRGLAEAPASAPPVASLDYLMVRLPATDAGLARAQKLALNSDQCADLYGQTADLPDQDVLRQTLAPDRIAPPIRQELSLLDPGEISTRLRSPDGSQVMVLMLCSRNAVIPQGETRAQIVDKLRNQRYEALANGYLDELRSAAKVVAE